MRLRPDPKYLALVCAHSKPHAGQQRDDHRIHRLLHHLLAIISSNHLGPHSQAPVPVHGQGYRRSYCRFYALWLVYHSSRRYRACLLPAFRAVGFVAALANAHFYLELFQQYVSLNASSPTLTSRFTLVTNAPDFASRARVPGAAIWPQLIAMPIGFSITSFLGIVIASASQPQFGVQIWDVVKVCLVLYDSSPQPDHRLWTACWTTNPRALREPASSSSVPGSSMFNFCSTSPRIASVQDVT